MSVFTKKHIRVCQGTRFQYVQAVILLSFVLSWIIVMSIQQTEIIQFTRRAGYAAAKAAPDVQTERRSLVAKTCQCRNESEAELPGKVEKVFLYEAHQAAYCSTHKIASTFWVRIFRWLHNDTRSGRPVHSPLDITKQDAHLLPLKKTAVYNMNAEIGNSVKTAVDGSFRFMFTREPFARLWSVYIDKFLLPDNYFWSTFAPEIVKLSATKAAKAEDRGKVAVELRRVPCPTVSFREFLEYIVHVDADKTGQALDDHFRPVHYGCNPCQFRPDFIGKIESMREDSELVLKKMGLDSLIPTLSSSDHVQQEIDMLVEFNFYLVVDHGYQSRCIPVKDLEKRLIRAFVYNGYLTEEDESAILTQIPLGKEDFKELVMEMYMQSNRTSTDVRTQRARYKVEAYAGVPRDVLYSLRQVFDLDFQLFGYDPFPPEIFDR